MSNDIFSGLTAVVQYRRSGSSVDWCTMAAFDLRIIAEKYAADRGQEDRPFNGPWEYRIVDVDPQRERSET